MRLLHTSDWHLGQALHSYDRSFEHQQFLDWLVTTLVEQQADALLIAGDIFDTANPSAAAQKQLYRFLQQARKRCPALDIVVIAGNHDSPGRLEAPGPLLEDQGTSMIGHVLRGNDGAIDVERMVVPLHDAAGKVAAWCLAVPFLRPGDLPRPAPDADAADDGAPAPDPYMAGIGLLYSQVYAAAAAKREAGQHIVAMGHCHMVDGQASLDSERRIVIGGTEALSAAVFDPAIAYVALGHLHLAQRVGQSEHRRYSGSPLPLSFAEVGYHHQVLRIDLAGGSTEVTSLAVPRAVDLLRVPARPQPLDQVLLALAELELADLPFERQPFLEVRVLLDGPEPGLRGRIEQVLAGRPVRLAKIEPTRKSVAAAAHEPALSLDQLAQLQPDDIFRRLYAQRFGEEAPDEQLRAFGELLHDDGKGAV